MKICLIIFIVSSSNLLHILKDQIKNDTVECMHYTFTHTHTHIFSVLDKLLKLKGNEHAQLSCCHWKVAVLSLSQGQARSHFFP